MGAVATLEANKMIQAFVGNATYTANAAFFVKLHLGDPGAAGTSNPATETTRMAATMGTASGGSSANSALVEWTNYSTAETLTHVSFWTASSGGTFLGNDQLSSSAVMSVGDTFRLPATTGLTVNLTGIV